MGFIGSYINYNFCEVILMFSLFLCQKIVQKADLFRYSVLVIIIMTCSYDYNNYLNVRPLCCKKCWAFGGYCNCIFCEVILTFVSILSLNNIQKFGNFSLNILVITVITCGHYGNTHLNFYYVCNNKHWTLLVIMLIVFFIK